MDLRAYFHQQLCGFGEWWTFLFLSFTVYNCHGSIEQVIGTSQGEEPTKRYQYKK